MGVGVEVRVGVLVGVFVTPVVTVFVGVCVGVNVGGGVLDVMLNEYVPVVGSVVCTVIVYVPPSVSVFGPGSLHIGASKMRVAAASRTAHRSAHAPDNDWKSTICPGDAAKE